MKKDHDVFSFESQCKEIVTITASSGLGTISIVKSPKPNIAPHNLTFNSKGSENVTTYDFIRTDSLDPFLQFL